MITFYSKRLESPLPPSDINTDDDDVATVSVIQDANSRHPSHSPFPVYWEVSIEVVRLSIMTVCACARMAE